MSVGLALSESLSSSLAIKAASFLISVWTVRVSSVADYGRLSVNFQLVISLSLFLLKEGFRRSALRLGQSEVIVLGSAVTCTIIIPLVTFVFFIYFETTVSIWTVLVLIVSLELESLSEIPLFHHAVNLKNLQVRNRAETWAGFSRSVVMLVLLVFIGEPILAFSVSQLVSAWILIIVTLKAGFPIHSIPLSVGNCFKAPIRSQLFTMVGMSAQKFFLSEGERILTLYFLNPLEIGLLSVVTNLGSLVLRLVFAPIEDIAFTALASSPSGRLRVFQSVLVIESTVGLIALCFGPPIAESVLAVMYGSKWLAAASLLSTYSGMIFLFAINGCFEAYFYATVDSTKIQIGGLVQLVSFFSMFLVVWSLSSLGPLAVLLGSSISMLVRIAWASTSLNRFRDALHPFTSRILTRVLIGGMINFLVLMRPSDPYHRVGISGLVGLATLASIFHSLKRIVTGLNNTDKNL